MGDVPPAVSPLLLTGDVETNPGRSCFACSQTYRKSDTPLTCHTPDCEIRTRKRTQCSGVPRSQPWHCSTHGGPGPQATTQTFHACYSCYHPFRPGTRAPAGWLLPSHAAAPSARAANRGSTDTADLRRMLNKRAEKTTTGLLAMRRRMPVLSKQQQLLTVRPGQSPSPQPMHLSVEL